MPAADFSAIPGTCRMPSQYLSVYYRKPAVLSKRIHIAQKEKISGRRIRFFLRSMGL
ncbi:MAG: hypothetical protein R6X10_02845 [Desulfobacterales bacterium]